MGTSFRISALRLDEFADLFGMTDDELAARGARRVTATSKPGYPCRVSLVEADIGERLLLPYTHHDVDSPYRASGPVYVREAARQTAPAVGEVPPVARGRLLSFRAYDAAGMMCGAEVAEGREFEAAVGRLFADGEAAYVHVHNARPGCYSCRVDRAGAPAGAVPTT